MPIYEYQCQHCGHYMEAIQRMSDDDLTDCPECAEPKLKKLISAAGFRLKGGGWYETDFKAGNKRNLAGEGKSEGKAKSESKSSDSKPAKTGTDS